jgi:hypothetical protein
MRNEARRAAWRCAMAVVVVSGLTAMPARAQDADDDEARWMSRVSVGRVVNGDAQAQAMRGDGTPVDVSATNGIALFYDLSRRLTARMSAQVGFGYWTFPSHAASPPVHLDGFRAGELHVGVVYGTNSLRVVNVYGAALLVANTRDVAVANQGASPLRVSLAAQVGPAIQGGILIGGCGSRRVGVDLSVRRSLLRTTVSGGALYDLSPWVVGAGVTVRH